MGEPVRRVPVRVLGDRYELESLIATGGMGQVWRGRDALLGRPVAVKVLRSEYTGDPVFLSRFRSEAHHTAAVGHRNIAALFDYGEQQPAGDSGEHVAYLVMELVDGVPLSDVLHGSGGLPAERTLHLLRQTGLALTAAHAAGVVHRDVTPRNVLVCPDDTVKVTDFGIAWSAGSVPLTRTGQVVGTAQYLSPEQAQGLPATAASDVYSLGMIAYECLAGRRAFDGENSVAIALMQLRSRPDPLPLHVPAGVRELVDACLVKDPAARIPDGAAFVAAVDAVRAGRPLPALSLPALPLPALSRPAPSRSAPSRPAPLPTADGAGAPLPGGAGGAQVSPAAADAPVPSPPPGRAASPTETTPTAAALTAAALPTGGLPAAALPAGAPGIPLTGGGPGPTDTFPLFSELATTTGETPQPRDSQADAAASRVRRRTVAVLAAVLAVLVGGAATVLLLAGSGTPARTPAATGAAPSSSAAAVLAAADHVGRPLAEVTADLEARGLQVQPVPDPRSDRAPDLVTSLDPVGRPLSAGDTVVVRYAVPVDDAAGATTDPGAPVGATTGTSLGATPVPAPEPAPVPAPAPAPAPPTATGDDGGGDGGDDGDEDEDDSPGNGNGNGNGNGRGNGNGNGR
ncbi:serine/threonine-protein kinase [Goekera deserti]|uniref:serine/threonine-protein kinase n=1 Tax=Goekera deserti TaxID=2497753 RepID=UPI001877EB77|nr:serine/threonine-protein kinase [Goekera deserti]